MLDLLFTNKYPGIMINVLIFVCFTLTVGQENSPPTNNFILEHLRQHTKLKNITDQPQSVNIFPNLNITNSDSASETVPMPGDASMEKGIPVPSLRAQLRMAGTTSQGEDGESRTSSELVLRLDKDYTPAKIADYVNETGDEKGISQLISEMIQDGQIMASQDDLIIFLENVQKYLVRLRKQKTGASRIENSE